MDHHVAPEPADPTLRLTRDAYYIATHTLRSMLPAPEDNSPEATARRDHAAIVQVAAMLPANADEAFLAAQCVGARLYGAGCLRQAHEFDAARDQAWARKCGAQGLSSLRESRQARSLLARLQAAREKREQDPAATDRAAWSEHCTLGLMADALAGPPPTDPVVVAEPPPVVEPPTPQPPADGAPVRDLAAEAEMYAIIYPRRARLIRAHGRLPDSIDFGPPDPELVPFIATGTTPALHALDAEALEEAAAAG
jgi:hypothetical protein